MNSEEKILEAYQKCGSVREASKLTGYSWNKVAKTLSSAGIIVTENQSIILNMYENGKTVEDIAQKIGLSVKTVQSYLPRKDLYIMKTNQKTLYESNVAKKEKVNNNGYWGN